MDICLPAKHPMREKVCRCAEAGCNVPLRNYGEKAHSEPRRPERRSEFVQKESGRLAEQYFTAALLYHAKALPRAQHAACGENCHVRGIR
jgi:hypothetical protein